MDEEEDSSTDEEEPLDVRKKKLKGDIEVPLTSELPNTNTNKVYKKRGRKPVLPKGDIIDPSIINNKTIQDAKKYNKEMKDKRRLEEDISYDKVDVQVNEENTNVVNKKKFLEFLKPILMMKDKKAYDLYEALANANAGITFAQLFAVSPFLKKLCAKGLKLDRSPPNTINSLVEFDEDLSDLEKACVVGFNSYLEDSEKLMDPNIEHQLKAMMDTKIVIVIGFLKDTPVRVLVDSGASINAITSSFFSKIKSNVTVVEAKKTWFKVAGTGSITSEKLVKLKVDFTDVSVEELFWVIDDDSSSYDIIFGRGIQKKYRLLIDPDDDGLYVKTSKGLSFIATAAEENNTSREIYKITVFDDLLRDTKFNKNIILINSNEELSKLINEFSDVLVNSIDEVSISFANPHTIQLSDEKPIKLRPYRISLEKSLALKEEIIKLLKHGLIEPSHSPWAFPVVLVRKKNGKWRMCVDYRRLNFATLKDSYAIPFMDELIESVYGAKIFSALDLFAGYHQIPMAKEDIEKTAFTTKFGNYNFVVMPFGLTNAPATFQREMNRIFMPLIGKCLFVYLDILVYSPSVEQHLIDLRKVFTILRENKFSANLEKCKFFLPSVEVLGHVLSEQGIQPIPSKIFAISSWKKPSNVKQLRSFLGLVSYYRKFIPNFAFISESLYKLTSPKSKFIWSSEHTIAFDTLRNALCDSPILKYPNPNLPFLIRTDASAFAIGAVLLQFYEDSSKEHPVYYVSRSLHDAELRYSVTEKEGLAVIFALKKFRSYIAASRFDVTVITDHKPLVGYFNNSIPISDRHTRWIALFNEFKVKIKYEKGKDNLFADSLSRFPSENVPSVNTIQDILNGDSSISDSVPSGIVDYAKNNFSFLNGVLVFRDNSGKYLRVIEDELTRHNLALKAHLVGHEGVAKTLSRLKEYCYWPGMRSDVEKIVKTCFRCQFYRPSPLPKGASNIPTIVEKPFIRVGLDIVGPLPETHKGNKYLIVLVDYVTKWVEASALRSIEAKDVMAFLQEVFSRHGLPELIVTDNGRQFIADTTKAMTDLYGTWIRFVSPRHPEANGLVENRNREIVKILRHLVDKQTNWDEYLHSALWALRTSKSSVTGFSSFELLYGRKDLWPLGVVIPDFPKEQNESEEEYTFRRFLRHQKWVKEAIDNIQYAHAYWLERSKSVENMRHLYKPGDLVLVRHINRSKLEPFYLGPFRVLKASKFNTVVLQNVRTKQILERNIHIKDVKPFLTSV